LSGAINSKQDLYREDETSLEEAVRMALAQVKGSYAIAVIFTPLTATSMTHATFDKRWLTIIRHALKDLSLAPDIQVIGWMHSHPRLSIFLSSIDEPTAVSMKRYDPNMVAVVVNPYDDKDIIGGFTGPTTDTRIPVEFEMINDYSEPVLQRLAVLGHALPDFDRNDLILPHWVPTKQSHRLEAMSVCLARVLNEQRRMSHLVDNLNKKIIDLKASAKNTTADQKNPFPSNEPAPPDMKGMKIKGHPNGNYFFNLKKPRFITGDRETRAQGTSSDDKGETKSDSNQ